MREQSKVMIVFLLIGLICLLMLALVAFVYDPSEDDTLSDKEVTRVNELIDAKLTPTPAAEEVTINPQPTVTLTLTEEDGTVSVPPGLTLTPVVTEAAAITPTPTVFVE